MGGVYWLDEVGKWRVKGKGKGKTGRRGAEGSRKGGVERRAIKRREGIEFLPSNSSYIIKFCLKTVLQIHKFRKKKSIHQHKYAHLMPGVVDLI